MLKCAQCGLERFIYWQTITEAVRVRGMRDDGTLVIGDKWETVDCIESGAECSDCGEPVPIDNTYRVPGAPVGWNGNVIDDEW